MVACVTPAASVGTEPTARGAELAAPSNADDSDILRERVSRLERRLADVDAKLGLLVAQRAVPRPAAAGPFARPYVASQPERTQEGSLGAASIDLPPRGGGGGVVDEAMPVTVAEPVDDGPPIVIRLDGSTSPSASERAPSLAAGAAVQDVYEWAQTQLKAGDTAAALVAFDDILHRASGHELADNAMYWLGYCHAQSGNHRSALDVWQRLPVRFPTSPKVADALFGMAQSHEALAEPALAETLYLEIVTQYPRAETVHEAQRALKRLRP